MNELTFCFMVMNFRRIFMDPPSLNHFLGKSYMKSIWGQAIIYNEECDILVHTNIELLYFTIFFLLCFFFQGHIYNHKFLVKFFCEYKFLC